MSTRATSDLTLGPGPVLVWTIRGWRGKATANATRPAHWGAHARDRKADRAAWDGLLAVATAGLAHKPASVAAWRHGYADGYRLTIEEWGRPRDLDAVVQAHKFAVDSLVRAGWLPGDAPDHLRELVARDGRQAAKDRYEATDKGVRLTIEALPADAGGAIRLETDESSQRISGTCRTMNAVLLGARMAAPEAPGGQPRPEDASTVAEQIWTCRAQRQAGRTTD